ncbi:MAG: hypothetical protein MZV63_36260 [Marinilabiliales bacterium]|nr:hypothetical protein [Marinilabiliales bacterium]
MNAHGLSANHSRERGEALLAVKQQSGSLIGIALLGDRNPAGEPPRRFPTKESRRTAPRYSESTRSRPAWHATRTVFASPAIAAHPARSSRRVLPHRLLPWPFIPHLNRRRRDHYRHCSAQENSSTDSATTYRAGTCAPEAP